VNDILVKETLMAKGKVALVSLMVLGGMSAALPASASGMAFDSGCALLNQIIQQSILDAIIFDDNHPADSNDPDYGGAQSCSNTSATVSSAYRASLIQMNMVISWNVVHPDAGTVCTNHNLNNCYPYPDPAGPPLKAGDLAFIQSGWRNVRNSVISQMPWGVASDMSYFDARSLAGSLRSAVSGPRNFEVGSLGSRY
jgi:hypothetical protein